MTPKHLYDDLQEEMIQLSLENQHLRNVQEKVVETMVDKHIADRLHNENEHYLNELLKLKSSLDNMVPKSQLKMLEFEATWLFQEIERLQNVVDSAMIRNMPEALQLERCFVSAEVCSSFFVRALGRLGRLLDKNPNHSTQLEFALFDTSVYDWGKKSWSCLLVVSLCNSIFDKSSSTEWAKKIKKSLLASKCLDICILWNISFFDSIRLIIKYDNFIMSFVNNLEWGWSKWIWVR